MEKGQGIDEQWMRISRSSQGEGRRERETLVANIPKTNMVWATDSGPLLNSDEETHCQ